MNFVLNCKAKISFEDASSDAGIVLAKIHRSIHSY